MTFTNTIQPIEIASAVGIGLILLMALGYLLVHAGRMARELGVGAVRAAFVGLGLAGAFLVAFVAWKLTGAGGTPVTLRVEAAGLLYRSPAQADVLVGWSEIHGLTRMHTHGQDLWTLQAGQRELAWDGSVSDAVTLQNLILDRAGLTRRDRKGEGEEWTATWTRPPGP